MGFANITIFSYLKTLDIITTKLAETNKYKADLLSFMAYNELNMRSIY